MHDLPLCRCAPEGVGRMNKETRGCSPAGFPALWILQLTLKEVIYPIRGAMRTSAPTSCSVCHAHQDRDNDVDEAGKVRRDFLGIKSWRCSPPNTECQRLRHVNSRNSIIIFHFNKFAARLEKLRLQVSGLTPVIMSVLPNSRQLAAAESYGRSPSFPRTSLHLRSSVRC